MSTPQTPAPATWRRRHSVGLLFAAAITVGGALGVYATNDTPSISPTPVVDQSMLNGQASAEHRENLTPQPAPAAAHKGTTAYDLPATDDPERTDSLACKAAQANAALSIKQLDVGALNQALTVAVVCSVTGK